MAKALSIDKAVDKHLKPVKDSDGTMTALEISTDAAKVNDLTVMGEVKESLTVERDTTIGGDVILTSSKKLILDNGEGSDTYITSDHNDVITLWCGGNEVLQVFEGGGGADDGIYIQALNKFFLDGHGDTYIHESAADDLQIVVGGDVLMQATENGTDGNVVSFREACAGFTRIEATEGDAPISGGGGNDTDIDFRHSNKYRLEMTADITNMALIFPAVSGNFLLVCTTDGDHDVTNWKVYENDESAATTNAVMWAGGSVPAFTSSGVDIVSFYWDATEQQCYGTASLAFATP